MSKKNVRARLACRRRRKEKAGGGEGSTPQQTQRPTLQQLWREEGGYRAGAVSQQPLCISPFPNVPRASVSLLPDHFPNDLQDILVIRDFISQEEEGQLLADTRRVTGRFGHGRRTGQYGYTFANGHVSRGDLAYGPLPESVRVLGDTLGECMVGRFGGDDEAILINEYEAGEGIGGHTDHGAYGEVVGVVGLGSTTHLEWRRHPGAAETFVLEFPARAAVVFWGKARGVWKHGIPTHRFPRTSVTFRTVGIYPF
jgi:hypothetical protein